ncbi:MAG: helix-turn-helix domain-containing protein [Planctomycetia bacterium]|nr:helix-turn-helix domain-containing protein [Planctomycetia bacterium]
MSQAVLSDPFLVPEKTAEMLGVSSGTLAVWRCSRRYPELRYTKVGRSVRYRLSDIERFISSRTVGASAE